MFKLIELLWPFFLEVFVNNQDVTDTVRKPQFILKTLLGLVLGVSLVFYFLESASDLLTKTLDNYKNGSTDYENLEKRYDDLSQKKREQDAEFLATRLDLTEKRRELTRCQEEGLDLKKQVYSLEEIIHECNQRHPLKKPPVESYPSVIDRLKGVK